MTPVTCDITVSTDGYAAGPNQSLENPLGEGGMRLHRWALEQPAENAAQMEAILEAGAYIMGRNMFGPGRGEWDDEWTGWWGDEPPYHAPVFVLTHYPRAPLVMAGGTTFTFVTDGIESALEQARAAAGELSVAIAGGASTVRQYLAAGLIDELRLHIAQVVQGTGEPLLEGLDDVRLEQVTSVENELVTHVVYRVVH
ncbi:MULTISPECIES: dihydrofolate reductase family protein [unclassified Cryobacterium]|uniref:dihydrofolate reductase family protein n=1 Tax=unclassified Cryobacterium TaxID=2649013 RepID=UPI00106D6BB3|nr:MULTISPECIES: dihydrofolate reductase family protein [unclassified Cryobacterium]TFC50370.1 dihydrofolate reductase [Cryobacterium sp. TMB3-1-2]TFC71895.1 dihydrofolate reductase [Cryobacterium sp. TMB3-15]TFC78488.1 dihydrofolate reductase [Cryobacterium sp. TMB3-10]TFD44545.1 dihydrofolate reductase [Cryobacterium sp. TMB3-12]